ncbi:MAG: caspase family protein [Pseudomonadales bacterium]|nr:caspase family protein [Pseudomonadales bacterium]
MARGISLHIGVNIVDGNHYVGIEDLSFCEADAISMQALAEKQGFETQLLLSKQATRGRVTEAIERAAAELESGDIFLITYAGHGSSVPDINRDESREKRRGAKLDRKDETWCLYDAQQVDDERGQLWSRFKKGVRICILSDSCHSGTAARGSADIVPHPQGFKKRSVSRTSADATYTKNRAFYDSLQRDPEKIEADLLLLSGCQDHEESGEDSEIGHGNFTFALMDLWQDGGFEGTYADLHKAIREYMPEWQNPNIYPDRSPLKKEKPFTI